MLFLCFEKVAIITNTLLKRFKKEHLWKNSSSPLILSDMVWEGGFLASPTISYNVKNFLIGLTSWALFYSDKIYFYTFWPDLHKFFAEGHEIWPFRGRERYNILRISDTYKKSFISILLKIAAYLTLIIFV